MRSKNSVIAINYELGFVKVCNFVIGVLLAIQIFNNAQALAEPSVTGIRVHEHPEYTRFVIDLSETVKYKIFSLANPYRVVVELPAVNWRAQSKRRTDNWGVISSFHHGLFNPSTYRIVVNLEGPARIKKKHWLPSSKTKPNRLILDLVKSSRKTTLEARPWVQLKSSTYNAKLPMGLLMPIPRRKPEPLENRKHVIVLDPGHGGIDPGAISPSGLREKEIVLRAAKIIKERFEKSDRYEVYLTRRRDVFVRLRKRFEKAQLKAAGLFISLHADSIENKNIRGMSIYTLSKNASSKEAARLAKKENESELIAGVPYDVKHSSDPNVKRMILDFAKRGVKMAQEEQTKNSKKLAKYLDLHLRKVGNMLLNSRRSGGFAVLKSPDHPSVLLELGFLSNRRDSKLLKNKSYLRRVADAIVDAVDDFCNRPSDPCTPKFKVKGD